MFHGMSRVSGEAYTILFFFIVTLSTSLFFVKLDDPAKALFWIGGAKVNAIGIFVAARNGKVLGKVFF
jgi:hypothetical protein